MYTNISSHIHLYLIYSTFQFHMFVPSMPCGWSTSSIMMAIIPTIPTGHRLRESMPRKAGRAYIHLEGKNSIFGARDHLDPHWLLDFPLYTYYIIIKWEGNLTSRMRLNPHSCWVNPGKPASNAVITQITIYPHDIPLYHHYTTICSG